MGVENEIRDILDRDDIDRTEKTEFISDILSKQVNTDNSVVNENLLKENTQLKERVKLVLEVCDKNEKNSDYAIATDSVRAMLTDFPINPNKCEHKNIDSSDGLDECLDCGTKNY